MGGLILGLAGGGLFAFVLYLAGVQRANLAIQTLPPAERALLAEMIREEERAIDGLYQIDHKAARRRENYP